MREVMIVGDDIRSRLALAMAVPELMKTDVGRRMLERYFDEHDSLTLRLGDPSGIVSSATPTGHHHRLDPAVAAAKAPAAGSFLPEVTDLDRRRIADAEYKRRMRAARLSKVAAQGGVQ